MVVFTSSDDHLNTALLPHPSTDPHSPSRKRRFTILGLGFRRGRPSRLTSLFFFICLFGFVYWLVAGETFEASRLNEMMEPYRHMPFPFRPPPPPPPHGDPIGPPGHHGVVDEDDYEYDGDGEGPGKEDVQVDWSEMAELVKDAFKHAYGGYEKYASPHDELLPISNGSIDNFNGWGVSMVDSLDTMFLMGLHDEFERGVKLVGNISFAKNTSYYVPFFETTIRYLGGFLSAYALSHDIVLLEAADALGDAMLPVFNTTSGLPLYSVDFITGTAQSSSWAGWQSAWLAEIGSCQMEYLYLAHLTGKKEYYDVANRINTLILSANLTESNGMLPTLWNTTDGTIANSKIAIGGLADSAYEYLLKQYLLTGQTDGQMGEAYLKQINLIIENLLFISPKRKLLYATDVSIWKYMDYQSIDPLGESTEALGDADEEVETKEVLVVDYDVSRKFEHLTCFLPGLFALGAKMLPDGPGPINKNNKTAFGPNPPAISPASPMGTSNSSTVSTKGTIHLTGETRQLHEWAAEGLTYSCWMMYHDQPTGLGPEEVTFKGVWDLEREKEWRVAGSNANGNVNGGFGGSGGFDGMGGGGPGKGKGRGAVKEDSIEGNGVEIVKAKLKAMKEAQAAAAAANAEQTEDIDTNLEDEDNYVPTDDSTNLDGLARPRSKRRSRVKVKPVDKGKGGVIKDGIVRGGRGGGSGMGGTHGNPNSVQGRPIAAAAAQTSNKYKMRKLMQKDADERDRWVNVLKTWREEIKESKSKGGGEGVLPPGLGEVEQALPGDEMRDYVVTNQEYILRPETLESIFLMWRTTGDVRWRERGWAIFTALIRETKTEFGFAAIGSVERSPAYKKDNMPSFFLAETLKYLYLLFSDEEVLPLDRWVLNTEAHPLPVFEWTEWEREKFGIGAGVVKRD